MANPKLEREVEDAFLAFWETRARPTTRILGVDVVVPSPDTVPIEFDALVERFKAVEPGDAAAVGEQMERLLVVLFGEGTYETWKAHPQFTRGMLQVLVVWGMTNASGRKVTFDEAAELSAEAEAAKTSGKAPNRAARRTASSPGKSGGTGRSSSGTSAASTRSRRAS